MTREDVRSQLAKNPLVWKEWEGGIGLYATNANLNDSVETCYHIVRNNLYIEAHYVDDVLYGDPLHTSDSLDELKVKAEDHRLDLICRMLGIGD